MEVKKIHRRYPDNGWDYKALSTRVEGSNVVYYTLSDRGRKSKGVEILRGSNYDVHSSGRSYYKKYSVSGVPSKYKAVVAQLIRLHRATKWSKEERVSLN